MPRTRMRVCRVALLRRDHTWDEASVDIPDTPPADGWSDEALDDAILRVAFERFDNPTLVHITVLARMAGTYYPTRSEA